jgi:glutamate-1-semialdehyde 2,1-aminomutase
MRDRDELYDYMLKWTPGGSQTRSKSLAAYGLVGRIGCASHGIGSRLWTTDKVSYVDWTCSLGAMTLGYGRREVEEAAGHQLVRGGVFSVPHWLEGAVAEQLCSVVPGAEQARFVRTGSEACEAAVRIARKATGRDMVLVCQSSYHGWHAWAQSWKAEHPGVPKDYTDTFMTFAYNNLQSIDQAWQFVFAMEDEPAAILLEPTLFERPEPGFLEGLRERATKWGAVLIFDECVLGFRLKRAGGQEHFQVRPDLAVFGKALANGFPLASVCGPRELMQHADVVSGTFGGEAISLAVAGAVLDIYETEDVCKRIEWVGTTLDTIIQQAADFCKVEIRFEGWSCVNKLRFPHEHEDEALALFTQTMAQHGVLWHPRIRYASAAHTIEDIEQTGEAAVAAFTAIKQARETSDWSVVDQVPAQPFARKGTP